MEAPPLAQRAGVLIPGPRLPLPRRPSHRPGRRACERRLPRRPLCSRWAGAPGRHSPGLRAWGLPPSEGRQGTAAAVVGACCSAWLHQLTQGSPERSLSALALPAAGGGGGPESRQELPRAYARAVPRPAHLPDR